jgi:hypothetical protein
MSRLRYLLDEDTPHAIRNGLLRRQPEIEIRVVGGDMAPPISTPDSEILRWLESEGYILISRNRSTMPQHLHEPLEAGRHVPGILLLRPKSSIGRIIDDLLLIWEAVGPDEYRDRIDYIPLRS